MDAERFSFDSDCVLAAMTDRSGGESRGELSGLNLSFKVGDDPARVIANRQIIAEVLGFNPQDLIVPHQTHGIKVVVVDDQDRGRGADSTESEITDCDALVTNIAMLPLAVTIADCAPVLFYDPIQSVVAVAHAGWRGAFDRIAQKTLATMVTSFKCQPGNVLIGIGPCLQPLSLEVSMDVALQAEAEFPQQPAVLYDVGEKPHLDMPFMLKQQVLDGGAQLQNIEDKRLDTLSNQRFFSHRRQLGKAGRSLAIIMLRKTDD